MRTALHGSTLQPSSLPEEVLEELHMYVKVGDPAPDVLLEAYLRGSAGPVSIRVSDYLTRWVVLFFYPRDFTFVCPTELVAFEELRPAFAEADTVILAASTDSYWSHRAWLGSSDMLSEVSYPVLADTSHELAGAFGVLLEDGSAQRATYVIDPSGVVRHASVSDLSVGRSADETLRVLYALQTGGLCPAGWRPGEPTLKAA
jgi:peroxiredoxin (alkyl hydroperoxide reductase subunit C)